MPESATIFYSGKKCIQTKLPLYPKKMKLPNTFRSKIFFKAFREVVAQEQHLALQLTAASPLQLSWACACSGWSVFRGERRTHGSRTDEPCPPVIRQATVHASWAPSGRSQRAPSSSKRQVLDSEAAPPCELDTPVPVEPVGKGFPPVTDGRKHPSIHPLLGWLG